MGMTNSFSLDFFFVLSHWPHLLLGDGDRDPYHAADKSWGNGTYTWLMFFVFFPVFYYSYLLTT